MMWFWFSVVNFLGLIGLGLAVVVPLAHMDSNYRVRWSDGGSVLLAGILTVYVFTLLAPAFSSIKPLLWLVSAIGWSGYFWAIRRRFDRFWQTVQKLKSPWLGVFLLISFLYFTKSLSDRLWAYDARSIWFFAAKIIHFGGGIGNFATWSFPDSNFYHFDYPKLGPVLIAHTASAAGFWNEYFPKLAMFFLVLPATFLLIGIRKTPWTAVFLMLTLLGIPGSYLWIGYMDGFLALYGALGVLYWIRAEEEKSLALHVSSLLSLAAAASLKEEGWVFVALFIFFVGISNVKTKLLSKWPVLLALVPAVLWMLVRVRLKVVADPDFFSGDPLGRAWARILSGELVDPIFSLMAKHSGIKGASLILAGGFSFALIRGVSWRKLPWLPLFTAVAYLTFIITVYLITPLILHGHVISSVDRTTLPTVLLFCVCAAVAVNRIKGK